MDPNETLKQILEDVKAARTGYEEAERARSGASNDAEIDRLWTVAETALRLADNAEALDGWLRSGGFPPAPWAVAS